MIATKAQIHRNDEWWPPERVVASLDNSLRLMGTDYVDVFNLHGVEADEYDHALNTIAPALLKEKAKGKIRHIGLTENPIVDFTNEMLERAMQRRRLGGVHGGLPHDAPGRAAERVSDHAAKGIGTLLMFAVRSIFADPPRVAREMRELADEGPGREMAGRDATIRSASSFTTGGAANMIEAAYRFARHEPGVDVVLFGTGDAEHLRTNVAAMLKPPLPEADRAKLAKLFGHLTRHRDRRAGGKEALTLPRPRRGRVVPVLLRCAMPIFYLEPFEEQTNHPRWAASSLREACWVVAPNSYRARIKVGTATLTEGCWVTKDAEERRRMSRSKKTVAHRG